jgi:hypothetical protein
MVIFKGEMRGLALKSEPLLSLDLNRDNGTTSSGDLPATHSNS